MLETINNDGCYIIVWLKENQNLKIKIEAIKNTSREDKPVQVTNLDILKRLSKLETAVFGPNNVDHDLY